MYILHNPTGSFFAADQTPTPTRLIRDCDQLQLFDDLKHINPFENSFKNFEKFRADGEPGSELLESAFLGVTTTSEETLHTPNLYPLCGRPETSKVDSPENKTRESVIVSKTTPPLKTTKKRKLDEASEEKVTPKEVAILPKPTIIYARPVPSIQINHSQIISNNSVNELNVKDKLKNIIINNGNKKISECEPINLIQASSSALLFPTNNILVPILATPAKLILSNTTELSEALLRPDIKTEIGTSLSSSDTKVNVKVSEPRKPRSTSERVTSDAGDEKNPVNDKVQRNRAAAKRYRHKMKLKNEHLQDKMDRIQRENGQLRKELAEMKKLLLLHKDCSVTRNMTVRQHPIIFTTTALPKSEVILLDETV